MPQTDWISQAAAARELGCSATEIRRLRQAGEIDFKELRNGRVLCSRADVQRLKNNQRPSSFDAETVPKRETDEEREDRERVEERERFAVESRATREKQKAQRDRREEKRREEKQQEEHREEQRKLDKQNFQLRVEELEELTEELNLVLETELPALPLTKRNELRNERAELKVEVERRRKELKREIRLSGI